MITLLQPFTREATRQEDKIEAVHQFPLLFEGTVQVDVLRLLVISLSSGQNLGAPIKR